MVPKADEDNAKKYTHGLNDFVTRKESPNIGRTDDREGWKAMIADVCNKPGTS